MIAQIIIPVFNSSHLAVPAIESIASSNNNTAADVVIYNDGSDEFTRRQLEHTVRHFPSFSIKNSVKNIGYIKTVNNALLHCTAKYAILANSDVIVAEGWLDALVRAAESDETIASVNPLTNNAAHISIDMPAGINIYELNEYLKNRFKKPVVDVVTGVGFCMLLKMEAIKKVGLFDEVFGKGYCEDSDLCMRLTTNGWRTVVTPSAFVYHKGAGTFTNKHQRITKNRAIFDERWSSEYWRQYKAFKKGNHLDLIKKELIPLKTKAPKLFFKSLLRMLRTGLRTGQPLTALKPAVKQFKMAPFGTRQLVREAHLKTYKSNQRLSVTYILPQMALTGGVISVIQLVNALINRGIDARIATLEVHPEISLWPLYCAPMVFKSFSDMEKHLPASDIAVATHWTSAWVTKALETNSKIKLAVYFVQDFEPWFYKKTDLSNKCEDTYRQIDHKIVKSHWLYDKIKPYGGSVKRIRIGMDLSVFYERDRAPSTKPVILAMARPTVPHRGYPVLIRALTELKLKKPEVIVRLFGDKLNARDIPFEYDGLGVITDWNSLATVYSNADIYIDASDFQGFGRPALEAMACNTACVLTNTGGVNEYALDAKNALMVQPKDPKAVSRAVVRLIDDTNLRTLICRGGLLTARRFCHQKEAEATADFFIGLISHRKPILYQ